MAFKTFIGENGPYMKVVAHPFGNTFISNRMLPAGIKKTQKQGNRNKPGNQSPLHSLDNLEVNITEKIRSNSEVKFLCTIQMPEMMRLNKEPKTNGC